MRVCLHLILAPAQHKPPPAAPAPRWRVLSIHSRECAAVEGFDPEGELVSEGLGGLLAVTLFL